MFGKLVDFLLRFGESRLGETMLYGWGAATCFAKEARCFVFFFSYFLLFSLPPRARLKGEQRGEHSSRAAAKSCFAKNWTGRRGVSPRRG